MKKNVILHKNSMKIEEYIPSTLKIEDTDWFSLLTENQKKLLLTSGGRINYSLGETIVKQGFAASHIVFLERGIIKLNVENRNKNTTFKIMQGGNFIGLMCSFVNKKLDFSAVSVTDASVFLLDRNVFEQIIRENGHFALYIVKLVSELTNAVVHSLIKLTHKNANGAIATMLLDLHSLYNLNSFNLPFSRAEMANTLGYSKESIINTLSEFNRDGILEISGKKIIIKDIEKLISISLNG